MTIDFPDTFRPMLAEDALLYEAETGVLVYSLETNRGCLLNETALSILSMCNGDHSVKDISLELTLSFHVNLGQAQDDVRSVIRSLSAVQILSESCKQAEVLK